MAAGLGTVLLGLLVVGAALLIVVVVVVVVLHLSDDASSPSRAARAALRHGVVVHGVALVLLLATLVVVPALVLQVVADGTQGILLGLAPALAGLTFAAVHALGEATWPRPSGRVRRAPLTPRTVRDVAPRPLRTATRVWAGLTAVTLVACGLASDDGGTLTRDLANGSTGGGPFPGWWFGVPLLVAVAVVLLAAEGVLRLVAVRPSVADADPGWDLSLRRLSAHRVLRGAQLVLAWTAAGVLLVAGGALRNVGAAVPDAGGSSAVHLTLGAVALALAAVAAVGGLVLAIVPGPPVDHDAHLAPSGLDPAHA